MGTSPDEIEYDVRYVAFLDVLGFKDLVDKSVNDPVARETVASSLIAFRQNLGAFNKESLRYSQFSDSVLLSAERSEAGLIYMLIACASISTALLKRGVLVRGGLVVGQIYHESELLFGPAVAKAYAADRNGDPPRITISKEVVEDGRNNELFTRKWPAVLLQDDYDGQFIFNSVLHASTAREGSNNLLSFDDGYFIVERINKFCNENNNERSVVAKWRWFRGLWNRAVEEGGYLPMA